VSISGLSGSLLVLILTKAVGANRDNQRFQLVPVRPDWSDATDLLGYIKDEYFNDRTVLETLLL